MDTKLSSLSLNEARIIGGGFRACMALSRDTNYAVDQWLDRYKAMQEIDRKYKWFRPMMEVVAKRLGEKNTPSFVFRIFVGALFSVLNFVSCCIAIRQFLQVSKQGRWRYLAIGSLGPRAARS